MAVLTAAGTSSAAFIAPGSMFSIPGTGRLAFRSVENGRAVLASAGHGMALWSGRTRGGATVVRPARFTSAGSCRVALSAGASGHGVVAVSVGRAMDIDVTVGKPFGIDLGVRAV